MITFEKESLGLFPTPMYRLPNISRELGTNIWIKRDDLCGVALGGNKVRKLEYLLHDAKKQGYDLVMTTGQAQSNHAMLTAACALRMGMDCILVLKKRGVTARKGNQILNHHNFLSRRCNSFYLIPFPMAFCFRADITHRQLHKIAYPCRMRDAGCRCSCNQFNIRVMLCNQ